MNNDIISLKDNRFSKNMRYIFSLIATDVRSLIYLTMEMRILKVLAYLL